MPDQSLSTHIETPILFGPVVFDRETRALEGNGRKIRLEPKLVELLAYLAGRRGDAVSRGELIDTIWGDEGSDEALTQAVARLRRSLKELGGDADAIETLPKVGYRIRLSDGVAHLKPASASTLPLTRLSPLATHGIAFGAGFITMLLIALAWFAFAMKPITIDREIVYTAPDRANTAGNP